MMNKKFLYPLIGCVTAIVVCVATYFFFRGSKAYLNTIPQNATAIGRIDFEAFLEDADLTPQEGLQLMQRYLKADSEGQIGLDVTRPIYAFVTASDYVGVTAAVSDDGQLKSRLEALHAEGVVSEINRQRGYSWAVVNNQWLLAYDASKALMMGPVALSEQETLRVEMLRLLEQKGKESGQQSLLFEKLAQEDDAVVAVLAPELLPDAGRQLLYKFGVESQTDALLKVSMNLDDNELELETELMAMSQGVREYLGEMNQLMKPVDGALIATAHPRNVAWMTMRFAGKDLLETLRSNATIRTALIGLNFIFDADRIVETVNGDVAVEMTSPATILEQSDKMFSDVYVTAQVAESNVLDNASEWGSNHVSVQKLPPTDFTFTLWSQPIYFGISNSILYVGDTQWLPSEGNAYLRSQRDDIEGCRFYATFLAPAFFSALSTMISDQGLTVALPSALSTFEHIEIEMERVGEVQMKLIAQKGVSLSRELLLKSE